MPTTIAVIFGVAFTLVTVLAVMIAYRLINTAEQSKRSKVVSPLLTGLALFAVTAAAWFFALRLGIVSLSHAGFALLVILTLFTFGLIGSGPKGPMREYAGFACVLLAMFLMVTIA